MSKILAIEGDKERGNEVIALLEMLGGDNIWKASGEFEKVYYSISNGGILYSPQLEKGTVVFTLEEFLEKYPYKVGDIVKTGKDEEGVIKQMRWVDNDIVYWVNSHKTCDWTQTLSVDVLDKYNRLNSNDIEHSMEIKVETTVKDRDDILFDSIIWHLRNSVNNGKHHLSGGDCETYFRELVKKVKENDMESCKCSEYEDIKKVAYLSINEKDYADEIEINLGDDYEYKFETNRLYILKKKSVYPKTYAECCDTLSIAPYYNLRFYTYEHGYNEYATTNELCSLQDKLNILSKLYICRNAYWKIAGEEMGLDKPWEPDWKNTKNVKYSITLYEDIITKMYLRNENVILAFPTEEMRDVFFENFKDLINQCKIFL